MRKLLNTLFITSEDLYLSLENENAAIWQEGKILRRIPLLSLENILCFSYKGASPALLGACVRKGIGFCFLTPNGRFLARAAGMKPGNILLHKEQYRWSDDEEKSCDIARPMIAAKIFNSRTVLMRALRDHPLSLDQKLGKLYASELLQAARDAGQAETLDELRGIEGNAAQLYFAIFDGLILANKKQFYFKKRTKRPPMDRINAMLSFVYTLLAHDCVSALETAGLDPYAGFLHRDRPGRCSLALDLMEELRSLYADRFVLTLVNNRSIAKDQFRILEDGAVYLNETGRKTVLSKWQERKRDIMTHPFLSEKIPWGLVPYVQSLLLARYLRGDLDGYPPFLWK